MFFCGFLFFPFFVFAGGIILSEEGGVYSSDSPLNFSSYISHNNKIQRMILSFETENVDDDLIWVFPLPASVETVDIEASVGDVSFFGKNLSMKTGERLEEMRKFLHYSQIWPYFYDVFLERKKEKVYLKPPPVEEVREHVKLYKHLKGEGMSIHLVAAKKDDVDIFLKDREVNIDTEVLVMLEEYINKNKDYSFVFSFIEAPKREKIEGTGEMLKSIKRGLIVEFMSDNIFYPFGLMQAYESEEVNINLDIIGLVFPENNQLYNKNLKVSHYLEGRVFGEKSRKDFLKSSGDMVEFTRIRGKTPFEYEIGDEVSSEGASFFVFLSLYFNKYFWYFLFFFFVVLSFIVGLIMGLAALKEERNKKIILKWGLLGLFNVFSVVGFAIRLGFEESEGAKSKKAIIIALYSVVFVALSYFVINVLFEAKMLCLY